MSDASANAGKDTVTFKKSLSGGTIEPESDLYVYDGTVLDGDLNNDGAPDIALSGAKLSSGVAGLILNSNDCLLDGVALVGFSAPGLAGAMVSHVSNCIVRSCYFGVGLDGTTEAHNGYDLLLYGANGCTIGQPGKGNVFAAWHEGIEMRPGQGNVIQYNQFGTTADGNTALGAGWLGISLEGLYGETSGNTVRNNVFGGLQTGISLYNTHGSVIAGNLLGLGADGTTALPLTTQGSRRDYPPRTGHAPWFIDNHTAGRVLAEGNSFDTTVKAAIEAKVYDKLDDVALGRVDFTPLVGGVTPTGQADGVLTVTSATAQPTAAGAEVSFALSAPAQVTVEALNIAGRPVALLARERPIDAGVQRLAWNGQSLSGVLQPILKPAGKLARRRGTSVPLVNGRAFTGEDAGATNCWLVSG